MTTSTAHLERAMGYAPGALERAAQIFEGGAGYTRLKVPTKRGRFRHVLRPTISLDAMLKMLRRSLESELPFAPQNCVHGCVKGRGILSNARMHLGQNVVLRLDIRQFFESIHREQVQLALVSAGLDEPSALLIGRCTTVDSQLPVGFSTSPLLANMVFDSMDSEIEALASAYSLTYTRYVDDLTFSGAYIDDEICALLQDLLESHGWTVQHKKTRFMRAGRAQYVTGLSVNDPAGPHVPRHLKRFLRLEIHNISLAGLEASTLGKRKLLGHINNVKQVNPRLGAELYSALQSTGVLTGRREDDEDEYVDDERFWDELGVEDGF